ncbi:30S ribosomal protein S8e [Methanofollis aquaemaris]|uniref:Small ribosomal subunit protein eS8 n=1 Tax=Methanofollis aquaemaris TaxID=126734 RepID=A0A8A3S5S4_9EURY|nr:30S ribosomal protein S8e [Methanofollis aquaemaris]QSZ67050.1 30S ribosomal protein S8e [Methanofollis aquaemaris]
MQWQGRSVRRLTGGRNHPAVGRRRYQRGRAPAETHIGENRNRNVRVHGGETKVRALRANFASVSNPASGETKKVAIQNVEENPADINYVRRNLLTKGAIIRTEIGRARIMSRPGQDGVVNAVLIE